MSNPLFEAEELLPELLTDESSWNGLVADTERPNLRRLWRQWGTHRIHLNRFDNFATGKDFWHPHPWMAWMRILQGSYTQRLRLNTPGKPTEPLGETLLLSGSWYHIGNRHLEHAVIPATSVVWTLMVSGPVIWEENKAVANHVTRDLTPTERIEHLAFYREHYPIQ